MTTTKRPAKSAAAKKPAADKRAPAKKKGINGPNKARFTQEYLKDRNATQAAIRAGYSPKTAYAQGARLLKSVEVQQAVKAAADKIAEETGITLERTLREIARGAFFDPRKFFHDDGRPKAITELDDETASVLAGMDVLEEYDGSGQDRVFVGYVKKYKIAERKGYLDMLMKHLGGYKEDNGQRVAPLADAIGQFLGQLHGSGVAKLQPVSRKGSA